MIILELATGRAVRPVMRMTSLSKGEHQDLQKEPISPSISYDKVQGIKKRVS